MKSEFFANNRKRLSEVLQDGVVVLAGNASMQLTSDQAAGFLQEGNVWWLTGVNEPGWKLIIENGARTVLVRPELTEAQKIFDGDVDDKNIIRLSGADEMIEARDFELYLRKLAKKHSIAYSVYDKTDYGFVHNPSQKDLDDVLRRIFNSVQDCSKDIKKLRSVKQPEEVKAIKKAVKLTCDVFEKVKNDFGAFRHEYEIEALFDYEFRKVNSHHAYDPIVAAGKNACTLHYVKNDARLTKNQLILMDVGARVDGYAADITRTYGYGTVSKRQSEIHSLVREAHERIIALLGPELPVAEYISSVDEIMKDALLRAGLIKSVQDDKGYRRYFPHAVSHGLGVDVHDSLGAPRYFEAGMVLTVEPGIYIPEEGIGVRIEDDILITDKGHDNLSRGLSTDL
jgi:Xaa-Pro aminopeptidase